MYTHIIRVCVYVYIHHYLYIITYNECILTHVINAYGAATISRLLKITGLFCKRAL